MPRIPAIQPDQASDDQRQLLDRVQRSLGTVPNLIAAMAHAPPVANAYLVMNQALSAGKLEASLRERLALAVGQANGCQYCVSAHSLFGANAGLTPLQIDAARRGRAADPRAAAALTFARQLLDQRGQVDDADVQALRQAGFDDREITEIIGHVAMNILTNYFNLVADTEIDFPPAVPLAD